MCKDCHKQGCARNIGSRGVQGLSAEGVYKVISRRGVHGYQQLGFARIISSRDAHGQLKAGVCKDYSISSWDMKLSAARISMDQ
jgi:hypothetical protein